MVGQERSLDVRGPTEYRQPDLSVGDVDGVRVCHMVATGTRCRISASQSIHQRWRRCASVCQSCPRARHHDSGEPSSDGDWMEPWLGGAALAAAGVFAISGAVRYRSGRRPELGRHLESTGLWFWQRNIIFAAAPLGVMAISAAVLEVMGSHGPLAATAAVTAVAMSGLVAAVVFTWRPPGWLHPRENVVMHASAAPRRPRDRSPSIVAGLRRGLLTALLGGGAVLFVRHQPPHDRSPLAASDYVFLGGCFVVATLVWWLLAVLSRR
jgi:hypothetical protein